MDLCNVKRSYQYFDCLFIHTGKKTREDKIHGMNEHFVKIFWFIVGLTLFGAFFSVYILIRFKGEIAERFADQLMIFWLSTAVTGGIGYLIGNSMNKGPAAAKPQPPGTTTADISATITTETKPEDKKPEEK